jgi:hypothetical protein
MSHTWHLSSKAATFLGVAAALATIAATMAFAGLAQIAIPLP